MSPDAKSEAIGGVSSHQCLSREVFNVVPRFWPNGVEPSPASCASICSRPGLAVVPHFKGDDLGWTAAELRLPRSAHRSSCERYLAGEDDIRDDLNAYAAELETMDYSPNNGKLMQHAIQTKQLITLRKPIDAADEVTLDKVLEETCRFLAAATDGVYQIDGKGWFCARLVNCCCRNIEHP